MIQWALCNNWIQIEYRSVMIVQHPLHSNPILLPMLQCFQLVTQGLFPVKLLQGVEVAPAAVRLRTARLRAHGRAQRSVHRVRVTRVPVKGREGMGRRGRGREEPESGGLGRRCVVERRHYAAQQDEVMLWYGRAVSRE